MLLKMYYLKGVNTLAVHNASIISSIFFAPICTHLVIKAIDY